MRIDEEFRAAELATYGIPPRQPEGPKLVAAVMQDSRTVLPTSDRDWKSSGTAVTTCPLRIFGLPSSAIAPFLTVRWNF